MNFSNAPQSEEKTHSFLPIGFNIDPGKPEFQIEIRDRKACLKFCRRISKRVLEIIDDYEFSQIIFNFVDDVAKKYIHTMNIRGFDSKGLSMSSKAAFKKVWVSFKEQLASSKNKKICLVTHCEWSSVFSLEGFRKQVKEQTQDYKDILKHIQFQDQIDAEVVVDIYVRLQFVMNKIVVNATIILIEMCLSGPRSDSRAHYLNDCLLMMNFPYFYGHYNHTKGKFAIECCNRCKICRSTLLPRDFLERLEKARYKTKELKTLYTVLGLKRVNLSSIHNLSYEKCLILHTFFLNRLSE